MKSVFDFLVEPKGERTTSAKEVNGKQLILNTELQNHQYVSRIGIVKSVPTAFETEINAGDEVIVHHNVFRVFKDIRGDEKRSRSYIEENLYAVNISQIFAYKRDGEWKSIDGFYFVKPIVSKDKFSLDKEEPLVGIVKYANDTFETGALVGFRPGMEYEFNIEGQRLYRIPANQITVQYEYKGDEEEYNPSWA